MGQASSGTSDTRSPLPGSLATMRLRLTSSATVAFERPRSRAMARPLLPPSRPRSIAARFALSSLKYLSCLFPFIAVLSHAGPSPGPSSGRGLSDSTARARMSPRGNTQCLDEIANQLLIGIAPIKFTLSEKKV